MSYWEDAILKSFLKQYENQDFPLNEYEWKEFTEHIEAFSIKRTKLSKLRRSREMSVIILEDSVVLFDLLEWERVLQNWK